MIKRLLFPILMLWLCTFQDKLAAQGITFSYEPVPVNSGFRMEGYWIWGGSMIKVDSVYHLFASRWPKMAEFPDGYRTHSEIVRATSASPLGPFQFQEVVIGERDSSFWDSNMAHNPTIHKIDSEYVLFYIGSDFHNRYETTGFPLRRVGYAVANSIEGPWMRSEKPLIEQESNNPAVLVEEGRTILVYRDEKLQTFLAVAEHYTGPFSIRNNNVWPDCKLEDFYLFKSTEGYHMICEDNVGGVSGHVRYGIHLFSENGIGNWLEYSRLIVYNHEIPMDDGSLIRCRRRERPQLFITDNSIHYLLTAIYDGENSWCQPVKISPSIFLR